MGVPPFVVGQVNVRGILVGIQPLGIRTVHQQFILAPIGRIIPNKRRVHNQHLRHFPIPTMVRRLQFPGFFSFPRCRLNDIRKGYPTPVQQCRTLVTHRPKRHTIESLVVVVTVVIRGEWWQHCGFACPDTPRQHKQAERFTVDVLYQSFLFRKRLHRLLKPFLEMGFDEDVGVVLQERGPRELWGNVCQERFRNVQHRRVECFPETT